jgi:hypothetical protein
MNNYITPKLQGRTGNMMFQIAHGYAKSLEYNRHFIVPSEESLSKHLEKTLFRKLDFNIKTSPSPYESNHISAPFHYIDMDSPSNNTPTVYIGWYQSEKYFKKYSEVIKDLFSPTLEFMERAKKDFPFLGNSVVGVINVRRGDYLLQPRRHPVISLNYINGAYNHLPKCDNIIVLSDDIQWCKENIKLPNLIFVDNYVDCDGLWLLSMCNHYIISNSTYTWWGAYLSRNENKVVIAPDTWFGPEINEITDDLYCDGWIKIPTYFDNGFIEIKN